MQPVVLAGIGHSVPSKVLRNDDFPAMGIDTSDEWIRTRTGIRERHIADEHTTAVTLAVDAARNALENSKIDPKEVELIIVACITPPAVMPSVACEVQKALGLPGIVAFDVLAACSGFIYGLGVAEAMMKARGCKTALVIGSEKLSSVVDWKDRNTCVLFGDGAGAAVLRLGGTGAQLVDSVMGADGAHGALLQLPRGGVVAMNGKEVFKLAVTVMGDSAQKLIERNKLTKDDLALVIPHQANNRIIEAIADRIKVPMERFFVNVDRYGNTSAASIPIALSEAVEQNRLKKGDWLLLVAFGGGLTWGAALVRW